MQRHYKDNTSGYKQWEQLSHAGEYLIYPENLDKWISIDEVSLSKGELYTIVTNKNKNKFNRKSVIAVINGTAANSIQSVLEKLPLEKRKLVEEVTLDMAHNMALAVGNSFPNCKKVVDRFHVVKLVLDAMQHLRVKYRWEAIDAENIAIKEAKETNGDYCPEILPNGDTAKELLARSRYLLYKYEKEWTEKQRIRANILFEKYPILKQAYKLVLAFRNIYKMTSKSDAKDAFDVWKKKMIGLKITEFNTVVNSIEHHLENILNFFNNRNTNANAESFNSKIKRFRANLRGVTDVEFFLFRIEKLFA